MTGRSAVAARSLPKLAPIAAAIGVLLSATSAIGQQKAQPQSPPAQAQPQSPPAQAPSIASQPVPPLTYSRWTKLCDKNPETKSRLMCRTGRDGRLDNGVPLVAAVLIEIEGEPKRVLQVTVPVGVLLSRGTRILVDDDENSAVVAPFMVCTNSGCLAQAEFDANAIARMKKGKNLYIQAFSMQQSVMTLSVPLSEFAPAYDGAAADPKQVEEQNKKLIDELQKKQQAQPATPAKPR
ncbi:MAG: invasion associated locus B family protein [Pseudorhodoplanes sp.]